MAAIKSTWTVTRKTGETVVAVMANVDQVTATDVLRSWKAYTDTTQLIAEVFDSAGVRLVRHQWDLTEHGWKKTTKF